MVHQPLTPCPYCGSDPILDVLEVWGREFLLQACCEAMQEELAPQLESGDLAEATRDLLHGWAIPCQRIVTDDLGIQQLIDFGLTPTEVSFAECRDFVARHHVHHQPSVGWKWGHGVRNGDDLVGVCTVGRPVARMLDATTTVEVTRLCVRRDLPHALCINACSMLYGAAAREARQRGYQRIITYTLTEEPGTSLRAAGWARETKTRGGSWCRPSRRRHDRAPTGRKWRWCRALV